MSVLLSGMHAGMICHRTIGLCGRGHGWRQRLAEREMHRCDLLLLIDDDLLRDALELLVVSKAQLGHRHVDGALMMRHHHRHEIFVVVARAMSVRNVGVWSDGRNALAAASGHASAMAMTNFVIIESRLMTRAPSTEDSAPAAAGWRSQQAHLMPAGSARWGGRKRWLGPRCLPVRVHAEASRAHSAGTRA